MKAMVLKKFGERLEYVDFPDPKPGYGEVVLDVEACGVCQTDLKITAGLHPNCKGMEFPHIPGHEICGRVSEVGEGVVGWKIGDRAIASVYYGCGQCENCRDGLTQMCEGDLRILGFTIHGGYAQKVKVRIQNLVRVERETTSSIHAAITTDAVATSYRAAFTAGQIKGGQRALVIGFGGLGVHLAQILKVCGVEVTVCDLSTNKLKIAPELGLNNIFCGSIDDMPCDEKFDVIFDVTGRIYDYDKMLTKIRKRGRFVMVGYSVTEKATFSSSLAHVGELTIVGTRGDTINDMKGALNMVERGMITPVVGLTKPLCEANEALDMLRNGFDSCGRIVLIP